MTTIDANTLRTWQLQRREFILVDTLPAESFAKGHLPDAINIVSDDILQQAPDRLPDKQALIVVYCASATCKRAGLSAERLARLGYNQVHHFVGGKRDWVAAGFPLE
ncbi:MAG: rhodanese-like domain-containing protein [Gammaproteobacteria bacterium]|nr:rhodanese-like domain-containing protein [Gammaproteobacteria bacterium]MDE1886849.1 rhodanese-like domain-containing protein [Gammaproteobacteria bacterium]MDE2023404.1 rhodanese-like domain-containing protein [Gammaproteobacteria bacterium]MDE2138879.1 rhodanese-like domain-containing protein [Gammaproteobacteria bacterium]MDE2274530.1 rhodanese-like domain-containing protein [Gammaproteobacteria bacterium]